MVDGWAVALTSTRIIVLLLGILTTIISFRAYYEQRATYLRDATIGFAIMTIGVFVEGALYQLTPIGLTQVHIIESVAIGFGFLALLRSFLR
ncbi:DUF7521 family protein [Halovenus sp. HT40]|uniref:DUF7521 family protein n=1 Tax=Halovenus sp. HT40 TaxID=3126691 RepID=UPI003FA52771